MIGRAHLRQRMLCLNSMFRIEDRERQRYPPSATNMVHPKTCSRG